uniref:Uncharacterized protein n=1 Tax=Caenorhabditis japonica TaxID=281687 RepID=A0A8R1I262_CAEJA
MSKFELENLRLELEVYKQYIMKMKQESPMQNNALEIANNQLNNLQTTIRQKDLEIEKLNREKSAVEVALQHSTFQFSQLDSQLCQSNEEKLKLMVEVKNLKRDLERDKLVHLETAERNKQLEKDMQILRFDRNNTRFQ